jgi:hypothetical protein
MDKQELLPRVLLAFVALICFGAIFWLGGGIHWLDKNVFPPRRPAFMPTNSVWIDAPPLPISWHHGWWFGCGMTDGNGSNYCRLVLDGHTIYDGEYASCRTRRAVAEDVLKLVSPRDSGDMWLFGENVDGVAGFTQDSDVLLPVSALSKCEAVVARVTKTR